MLSIKCTSPEYRLIRSLTLSYLRLSTSMTEPSRQSSAKNGEPATSGSGFTKVLPFRSKTLYDSGDPVCATNPSCAEPDKPPDNSSPKRSNRFMVNNSD